MTCSFVTTVEGAQVRSHQLFWVRSVHCEALCLSDLWWLQVAGPLTCYCTRTAQWSTKEVCTTCGGVWCSCSLTCYVQLKEFSLIYVMWSQHAAAGIITYIMRAFFGDSRKDVPTDVFILITVFVSSLFVTLITDTTLHQKYGISIWSSMRLRCSDSMCQFRWLIICDCLLPVAQQPTSSTAAVSSFTTNHPDTNPTLHGKRNSNTIAKTGMNNAVTV